MDDNVMRTYCNLPETPSELVQFDQGSTIFCVYMHMLFHYRTAVSYLYIFYHFMLFFLTGRPANATFHDV